MIITTPDSGLKYFDIMPRNLDFEVCILTDDSTNIPQNIDIDGYTDNDWYITLILDFFEDLVENRYYDMVLLDANDKVVFRDRIFVTSQDIDTFSVNSNPDNTKKYKSNSSANEYLTYGE